MTIPPISENNLVPNLIIPILFSNLISAWYLALSIRE